ncbi:MAG: SsrA-binding protein SmpB [Planctomycetota bacterium]
MPRIVVATNRKASHKYFLGDRYEAGIALYGSEVKTLRDRQATLDEAFAKYRNGEIFLVNCHMNPYSHAGALAPEALRERKLLLKKAEIGKIAAELKQRGTTLVPVTLYFNERGFAKAEIAIARTKKIHDKRETLRSKEANREIARNLGRRKGGGGGG